MYQGSGWFESAEATPRPDRFRPPTVPVVP